MRITVHRCTLRKVPHPYGWTDLLKVHTVPQPQATSVLYVCTFILIAAMCQAARVEPCDLCCPFMSLRGCSNTHPCDTLWMTDVLSQSLATRSHLRGEIRHRTWWRSGWQHTAGRWVQRTTVWIPWCMCKTRNGCPPLLDPVFERQHLYAVPFTQVKLRVG